MIKNLEEELENLENYTNDLHERYDEKKAEIIKLKKQLAIAVDCMREYLRGGCYPLMEKKLKEIEELEK